ncbi:probable phosphoenolpyruvate synthase [Caerostris extrusa]|uniref:Probable phosphoenolpyruvate synthase n=1 Tax=Caerostris extrusa TaxID=172846 RepID=A0AAV4V052_CAEEX|nr:probable phosphoenolpyruvate synthase [Caerostris extrusa]
MGAILATPITIFLALITAKPSDIIFWCKWIISYIYVELFKRQTKSRFDLYDMEVDHDPYKVAFLPHPEEITLESPLPESQLCNNADELFFYGMNSKSENLTVRLARNSNQEAEAWIYMKLSNGKIYQLLETTGYQQSGCDKKIFSCGGLQLQYLSPMRRWRIFYNGILRETSENDETSSRTVHVKFAFLWRASSDAFDFISDVDSKALATGLAQAKWNQSSPPLEKLHSSLNFYAQSGIIMGTVNVEGVDEEFDLYLFGERLRYLGDVSSVKGIEFSNVFGHVFKNGRNFFVAEVSIENVVKVVFGFVTTLNGNIRELKDTKSVLRNLSDKEKDENDLEAKFHADGKLFDLKGNKYYNGKRYCYEWHHDETSQKKHFQGFIRGYSISYPTGCEFLGKICQLSDATGGKGSSLGKLTELSKEFQNFVVPNGVVVTTSAYESFVTKEIAEEIKKLEKVLYSDKLDETKKACLSVMAEITNSPVPKHLLEAVTSNLEKVFPDKKHDRKFAVRSSATGEDTEQMSAAGQMDTYLGLTGMDEIMTAIKKCWASQFSYIAVQYKRQNGQIINSPMAVVVQQMISCDVAGVLFTCDPLTGNPTSISITANYGLGESVVSGSEEPDTIEIERQSEQELVIKNIIIGSKSHRIVVKSNTVFQLFKEDGGTSVEDVSENEKQSCCITNAMALRLAHLAVKIEKSYGSYRDIEWGFWNNNLYIFQSRPVTSGTGETDFEIDHEFDAPLRCENDYFTMCNVGVMPGATSTLGLDIILKYFNIGFQRKNFVEWPYTFQTTYYPRGLIAMYSHIMFYCVDLFQRINENPSRAQANAVGLFGRTVEDEELFEMSIERHKDFPKAKLFTWSNISSIYRMFLGARQYLNKNIRRYEGYHIPLDKCKTSQEVFDQLMYRCSDLTLPMGSHMICSESSGFWNMIILLTLQKAAGEMNADVYSDFAQLATTSDEVQSADVPSAMELLAYHISKEIDPEDFKNMSVEDALEWLEKSSTKVSKKYREFLERHGHRCLREFDIHSFTWRMDPKDLLNCYRI